MSLRSAIVSLLFLPLLTIFPFVALSAPSAIAMAPDEDQVKVWNRFADTVYALHERALITHEIRSIEEVGRYGGEFAKRFSFRETSYYDVKSNRLLSRVRRDQDKPDNVHIVEVFVYDTSGRIARDFSFIYLPWAHNAPIRTFINLHQHSEGLHAYRQFDASGNRLYENCEGKFSGHEVKISLEDFQIKPDITSTQTYKNCFSKIPANASGYLAAR